MLISLIKTKEVKKGGTTPWNVFLENKETIIH